MNSMGNIASETFTAVSAPIQYASCTAFQEGKMIEDYLQGERVILKVLGKWIYEKVTKEANLLTHCPEGGFYIFMDFKNYKQKLQKKNILTSKDLAKALLEDIGIAILPGSVFGRSEQELTIRLSFVNFDGELALKGVKEKEEVDVVFLKKYCGDTLEGIENLVKWLDSL